MTDEDKLHLDESRRLAQHEEVKGAVRDRVHAEIARDAAQLDAGERARAASLAEDFKHKAVNEVVETENELHRARGVARLSQFIDYVFYLIYSIVGLEIILELIGARDSNAFKQFIDALAAPLVAPFRGLVAEPSAGAMHFRLSYIVALIVYLMLHLAVNGLLRLIAHRKTAV